MDAIEVLLDPQLRERRDLGYLALGPTFAENFLTQVHGPKQEKGLGPGPRVAFYARPTAQSTPIDLGRLPSWLDPNLRRYEPATQLQFIPHYARGIVDGIAARTAEGPGEEVDRFIAVRRSGSVEYGAYCSWSYNSGREQGWLVHLKQVVLQFGQFLRFLDAFATDFDRSKSWTVWLNARNVRGATLIGFGEGWADVGDWQYRARPCLEDQFQWEFSYVGGDDATSQLVRVLTLRLEFAFGFTGTPRAYDRVGNTVGEISYAGVEYS